MKLHILFYFGISTEHPIINSVNFDLYMKICNIYSGLIFLVQLTKPDFITAHKLNIHFD